MTLSLLLFLFFQRFFSGPTLDKTNGTGAVGTFYLFLFHLNAFFTANGGPEAFRFTKTNHAAFRRMP